MMMYNNELGTLKITTGHQKNMLQISGFDRL